MTSSIHDSVNRFSRRRMFGLMAVTGVAVATGTLIRESSANSGVSYTATSRLNLRSRPNISSAVILVIPAFGVVVDYDNEVVNGFRSVDYKGSVGWVSTMYLTSDSNPPALEIVGSAKTTSNVNFRVGAATGFDVIKVVPKGTWVDFTSSINNGYRQVRIDGTYGWIADAFLGGSNAGAFFTTDSVNFRTGAGTSFPVKFVLIEGITVVDYDSEIVNGFRSVEYQGTTGWVSNAFLRKA
ncbi:MAG: SH3 domain-containing protein [Thermomicrobiales bacterium]